MRWFPDPLAFLCRVEIKKEEENKRVDERERYLDVLISNVLFDPTTRYHL